MTYEQLIIALHTAIVLLIPRYRQSIFEVVIGGSQAEGRPKYGYIPSFDILKGVGIIAVVVIHTVYFGLFQTESPSNIWVLNYFNTISRFTIAGFFMASGFLLTSPQKWTTQSTFHFYTKKIIRVFIPYAMVTYGVWVLFDLDTPYTLLVISGLASIPFYFVPVLFQLYTLYPLLHYLRNRWPQMLLWGSFTFSQLSYWTGFMYQYAGVVFFGTFLFYFVFGMVRKDILTPSKPFLRSWVEIIVWYLFLHAIISGFMVGRNIDIPFTTYIYNSQFLYGVASSSLILYGASQWAKVSPQNLIYQFLLWLGRLSLWVFLLHYPIQEVLFEYVYTQDQSFWSSFVIHFFVTWIIVIPLSILCNYIYGLFLQSVYPRVTKSSK